MSSSYENGARRTTVGEPLCWAEEYLAQWREPRVDLAELAKLRWIEGLGNKALAARYGRTELAVQNYIQKLRRVCFRVPGLEMDVRERILTLERQQGWILGRRR